MKNHLVQFIYALCALVVITCMSCQEDQIVIENPAIQKGSIINKVKVQDIPVLQKFITTKMSGKSQKSSDTGSYIETPFGFVPMQGITEVEDTDGNLNYTFTLLPKEPKPNTFYNLIVQADPDTKEPSSYVIEYQMEEAFAKDYFFNKKKFDGFKGNIKRYPSDYFIGDLFAKSDTPPCPCEQPTTTNSSGSSGSGDGSQNTGGSPVGGGDTDNEGSSNNNNTGGTRCTIIVHRQPESVPRWGVGAITTIEIYCRKTNIDKSGNNCVANNDGSCPDSTGHLGVSPIELVTYLEMPPPYSFQFLLEANRNLADATARFLYPFRNNSRELDIARETAISTIKVFADGTITKEQAVAMFEDNNTVERVHTTTDIFEAATAEKITGEQASQLLEYLKANTSEEATAFAKTALEALKDGGEVDFDDEIIFDSSFVHSKGKCIYDYIKQTNGSLFRNTISNFIDNGEYDLKMVVEPFPASDIADARTSDEFLDSKGLIIIRFNSRMVNTQNSVEWASNIFHEGIHAEIFRFVHENDPNVKPDERARIIQLLLFYKGSEWGTNSTTQHIHMTEKYMKPIAQALRQLDKNQFSLDHYMWFAWQGLIEHAPENVKPTQQELSDWANKSAKVLENNNIPCQ